MEQLEQVKYMNLVANAIMLHNVVDVTEVLSAMVAEGLPVTNALAAHLSPYLRDHLLRFGNYAADLDDLPPALEPRSLPDLPDGRL